MSTTTNYEQFLKTKHIKAVPTGMTSIPKLHKSMFQFQQDIVSWGLKRGRAAMFEECGFGKTIQEFEWSKQVAAHTKGKVLLIAPLEVSIQHMSEAEKFGYDVSLCKGDYDVASGINITNYEKLHKFDLTQFDGVCLDESSILKGLESKTRAMVTESFRNTPYRSAWTATPAPNDFMELGNHAEFLGVMNRSEMLATFFVHDGGDTSKWRIKGHAQNEFWKWVCSWAVYLRRPSDLGYEDGGFKLPELNVKEIAVDYEQKLDGYLFAMPASSLSERREARKCSKSERVSGPFQKYVGDETAMHQAGERLEMNQNARAEGTDAEFERHFSIDVWQRYASPVWMDINQSDTLTREGARDQADERHVCALQLQVIERAVQLWSNPGDVVFSPFGGIGSEGYVAVKMGRKYIGVELKPSYFKQAVLNLKSANQSAIELDLK